MYIEQKNPFKHIVAFIIAIIPVVYLAIMWSKIPDTVAIHFNAAGEPDDYSSKITLLVMSLVMIFITFISYIIVINVHKLDKKRTKGVKPAMFDTIALGLVVFITILNLSININGIYPHANLLSKVLYPAFGIFFIFLGNLMYNIKPNLFVGIRVPWTLNNEDNWKKTHRFGSKLFFAGGIIIVLLSISGLPMEVNTFIFLGLIIVMASGSIIYSYLYHRKSKKDVIH